jgi:hypothetical protein
MDDPPVRITLGTIGRVADEAPPAEIPGWRVELRGPEESIDALREAFVDDPTLADAGGQTFLTSAAFEELNDEALVRATAAQFVRTANGALGVERNDFVPVEVGQVVWEGQPPQLAP